MIRYIICLLLLLPLYTFAQNWKSFNQAGILFTASYPADWVNKVKDDQRVFFTSPSEGKEDIFAENINIKVSTHASYGTSLKIRDVIQDIVDNVKNSFISFKEEYRNEFKWNGIDAFEITYSGNTKSNEAVQVRITQRLCFYKQRLYLVTYTALEEGDNFTAVAKQIINTIKFKP